MGSQHIMSEEKGIIFSVFYDDIEIDEIMTFFAQVNDFLERCQIPMVYWIGDTIRANVTRQTLLDAIDATLKGTAGSGGDARVIPVIIMDDPIFEFFMSEFRNRYHWADFPVFKTAFEAYSFVQYINTVQET